MIISFQLSRYQAEVPYNGVKTETVSGSRSRYRSVCLQYGRAAKAVDRPHSPSSGVDVEIGAVAPEAVRGGANSRGAVGADPVPVPCWQAPVVTVALSFAQPRASSVPGAAMPTGEGESAQGRRT